MINSLNNLKKIGREKRKKETRIIIIIVAGFIFLATFLEGIILLNEISELYFYRQINKSQGMASILSGQKKLIKELKEIKREKLIEKNFRNLKINAKEAISVKINKDGKEKILFQKNRHQPLPIASITKLMTALTVIKLENNDLSKMIIVTKKAVNQDGDSKLKEGEKISIKNLLYMALIESSNDAAFALTEPIGEKKFVQLMNLNASKIGLQHTYYFNPTGLEPDDQNKPINYSTAEDLIILTKYIIENYPQIFEITKQRSYIISDPNKMGRHIISQNTDKLLGKVSGIIGGKTGWTPRAGGCLLLVLNDPDNNGYFVNVVLGSNNRFGDMEKIIKALGIKN